MSPIFAIRCIVEDFTDSFDLIGDRLSKSLIRNILSEYEEIWAEDPDDFNVALDCEIMLTLLDEHTKAIECLSRITTDYGRGIRKLRAAEAYAALHDQAGVENALSSLMREPKTSPDLACAFIAAGRVGDRDAMVMYYRKLIEEEGVELRKFDDEVLHYPDSYSSFGSLHTRERNEAVHLLFQYDINENRDCELYAYTSLLHYKLGCILNSIQDMVLNAGQYEALIGIIVANAISNGTYTWMKTFRDIVTVNEPRAFQELILNIEGARRFQALFEIGERLLTQLSADAIPGQEFLNNLMRETGGDIFQIYSLLELFLASGMDLDVLPLLEIITAKIPDIENKAVERENMESFLGPQPPNDTYCGLNEETNYFVRTDLEN